MWKHLSLSTLWGLLSITYQSRKLCLLENVNGKSAVLKTVVCEWLKFKNCFSKKYVFSTSLSPWGRRNPDFAVCFAKQSRSTVCIYIYIYSVFYNTQFRMWWKEDRDWQGMDWAPCLFELNKSFMLTVFSIPGIGKVKSFCYIVQMHCKHVFLASLPLTGYRIRETNADRKERSIEVLPNEQRTNACN